MATANHAKVQLTVKDALSLGVEALKNAGVDSPRLDAELLIAHALGWDRAKLFTYPEYPLNPEEQSRWDSLLQRRIKREPLPYLLGEWGFYKHTFLVTPAVLIPRPETELLVEGLLQRIQWSHSDSLLFLDVGTGSGCIGLSLAAEIPQSIGVLLDCSPKVLEIARQNAERLELGERVEFRLSSFPEGVEDLKGRLDVLVSNPPYVAEKDRGILPPEVLNYEPSGALFSGEDGLNLLRTLLEKGLELLRPGGWIGLEFGIGQADALELLAASLGYQSLFIENDLAGIPRALFAQTPDD